MIHFEATGPDWSATGPRLVLTGPKSPGTTTSVTGPAARPSRAAGAGPVGHRRTGQDEKSLKRQQGLRAAKAAGHLDSDGVGRRAVATFCRRCSVAILTGYDADRCGLRVRVDPQPLDALGELAAVMAGLATYTLRTGLAGRPELDHRYAERMRGEQPMAGMYDVLAEHRCGRVNVAGRTNLPPRVDRPLDF